MLRKELGNAFISKAREWVRNTSCNGSVKERKQVENAYDYYNEHHTSEQEKYLKKQILDYFSCLLRDHNIRNSFGEYCSIFFEQLLTELPKINLSNFQEDKINPQYTVIEYVFNIIIDRYYPKALATERQKEYELPTGLSDETKRNHQLIALKAFEFAKSQGWNDSYAFYTDRQLENILAYVNENVSQKTAVKKIQTLKKIMMEYQLNKLHSLEQLIEAAGEQGVPIQDDDIQKTKEMLGELVCFVNNDISTQKKVDKFIIQWVWKFFHGYSDIFKKMQEYPNNFCAMLRYEYSIISNEYPIFSLIYVEILIEFIKEYKKFPTQEQFIPLCWVKMHPDEECPPSIVVSVSTTCNKIKESESFKKIFGSTG